jgi:hypothetical protein
VRQAWAWPHRERRLEWWPREMVHGTGLLMGSDSRLRVVGTVPFESGDRARHRMSVVGIRGRCRVHGVARQCSRHIRGAIHLRVAV